MKKSPTLKSLLGALDVDLDRSTPEEIVTACKIIVAIESLGADPRAVLVWLAQRTGDNEDVPGKDPTSMGAPTKEGKPISNMAPPSGQVIVTKLHQSSHYEVSL